MENPDTALRRRIDEANGIVRRLFPAEGTEPPGLKLELVRVIGKAELRGYEACMRYFRVEPEPLPIAPADA